MGRNRLTGALVLILSILSTAHATGAWGQREGDVGRGATAARSVDTARSTTLVGRVIQADGAPIAAATVGLFGRRDTAVTTDSGAFALAGAPVGVYMLWVRRVGFQLARVPVTISRDASHPITVTLVRGVPVLPTIATTGRARSALKDVGFDQRKRAGQGQFFTYDDIARRQATKLSQVLQTVRGIRVWKENHNFEPTVEGTRGIGSCVSFIIDGVPQTQLYSRSGTPSEDVDNMVTDPSMIGAMEVYSSVERPAAFGPGLEERPVLAPGAPAPSVDFNAQQCALVVIWTRARLGLVPSDEQSRAAEHHGTRARLVPTDPACPLPTPADTIDVPLYATLESGRSRAAGDTAWSNYAGQVLAAFRGAFVMPTELPLPTFGYPLQEASGARGHDGAAAGEAPVRGVAPAWSTIIAFALDSNGTVSDLRIAASSLSGPADTTLLAAITGAGAMQEFPRVPASEERGRGPVRFDLIVSTTHPTVGDAVVTLGSITVPVWPLGRRVSPAAGPQPSLAPEGAAAGTADSATLEFVVDDRGRVAMSTVRAIRSGGTTAGTAFLARLAKTLPAFRFDPALIGACPVRQILTEGFVWRPT